MAKYRVEGVMSSSPNRAFSHASSGMISAWRLVALKERDQFLMSALRRVGSNSLQASSPPFALASTWTSWRGRAFLQRWSERAFWLRMTLLWCFAWSADF